MIRGDPSHQLVETQGRLARARPQPYAFSRGNAVGGCFVCFERGGAGLGSAGDRGWAAAVSWREGTFLDGVVVAGTAGSRYARGLLFRREGTLLERALRRLAARPSVVLVNATGRDHPRRAGMALHLGALLDLPTVGVTHRLLVAEGDWPGPDRGDTSPLVIDARVVGYWVRTRAGARPIAATAAWRTTPETAARIALEASPDVRTPEPIRGARRLAREARASAEPPPPRTSKHPHTPGRGIR